MPLTFVTVNPAEPELPVPKDWRVLHGNAEPFSDFNVTPAGQLKFTLKPFPLATVQEREMA